VRILGLCALVALKRLVLLIGTENEQPITVWIFWIFEVSTITLLETGMVEAVC
jgi:hypothetical protein